jgi:hypothetical protein
MPQIHPTNQFPSTNVVFSSYLEFWTMDEVHKPSYSECYSRSSSEHFRL